MKPELIVLIISILLQLTAALFALRLTRLTSRPFAWILISTALGLMALRRGVTLYAVISSGGGHSHDLAAELVAVIISFLMMAGIFAVEPIFRAQRRSEKELRESEAKYRDLFENAEDAIFIVDSDFRYQDVNRKAIETFGFTREEFLRMSIMDVIPPDQVPATKAEFEKLRAKGSYEKFTGKMLCKTGNYLDIEVSSSAIVRDGKVVGSRDIVRDITERRHVEEELRRLNKVLKKQATHDGLTGLPNRRLLFDRINQAIARSRRLNENFAVMFIDLDNFKQINDRFSHQVGDEALRLFSERLKQGLREVDSIGRLGGDEFAMVIQGIKGPEDAEEVIQKVFREFEQPLLVQGHECSMGFSIGISIYPTDGRSPEALIASSDRAMYEAKRNGKGTFGFASPASSD
ncbi:MAG: hypothetical protein C0617_05650 [Desulfuromonas sp.]|uniref:diguanylate cyclase domain-containing protein n=1 Tax=Desulfuromonas sp. TaxID=892 RepID=UPI000CAEDD54|nr:diguanylate cyclase [Desulfuromonas sp.]PLX85169.1 MAG: hypothetical protein C0617_05650 [Desulfuromonas sp.]